jgi:Fusaric acid resistance protein-like
VPQRLPFAPRRLEGNPILHRDTTTGVGRNINGPSLIIAPPWIEHPLGRYYLYFAHHRGTFIRLATANRLEGPWRLYEPGTLHLAASHFPTEGRRPHIASPDVHVDEASGTVRMYYHGLDTATREQHTRVALSTDGIHFEARQELLGRPYFRVFAHDGWWYALAKPGILYRSADGLGGFERGPRMFDRSMRHSAVLRRGDELLVFWSQVGDCPERILCSPVALDGDWTTWRAGPTATVLEPEEPWEGAGLPLSPSVPAWEDEPVRQLRDPAIFVEDDRAYLLYSVAGESGIAVAELEPAPEPAPDPADEPAADVTGSARGVRLALSGLIARYDPGLAKLRAAAVTIAATLASFGTALVIEHLAKLSVSIVILAVALTLSMGRMGQRAVHRSTRARMLAAVVLPLVAVGANEIGTRIFQQPDFGDALFVAAISATIWVRRFGPVARQIGAFATLPLVAMLIVPAPGIAAHGAGSAGDGRWWSALVALVAIGWVTATRFAAERAGVLAPATRAANRPVPTSQATSSTRTGRRIASSSKMALQMAVALAAAFAVGRSVFGLHWTWVVLTAFIVCTGNRGRADVTHKAAMRLIGAGTGTLAATTVSGVFPAGDSWSIVVIFAVLALALWLRQVNYAFWAAGMTAALALLYGYYGERGVGLLGTRLAAILVGAALAVCASWLIFPIRTSDVIRRDIAVALAALDGYLACLCEDPALAPACQDRFRDAVSALERARALLRAVPSRLRRRIDYLPALTVLEQCATELPSVTAVLLDRSPGSHWRDHLDRLRADIGELRQADALHPPLDPMAWNRLAVHVSELPGTLDSPPPRRPARDRFWASSQKVLSYVNRVHGTTYQLVSWMPRDEPSLAYLVADASGRQAQLTWSRDAGLEQIVLGDSQTQSAEIAAGRTPSGFPYRLDTPAWITEQPPQMALGGGAQGSPRMHGDPPGDGGRGAGM